MGCCPCVGKKEGGGSSEGPPAAKYSWEKKDRVDRSLLIISDQQGGVVGRLPGQLNGRQFRIRQCQSATILVMDHTDTVAIEKCVDCQILVGPTKGSLYMRECTNCQLVVACQQFRARDCKKCTVSLFSSTQPVIESSVKLKFSCFQCSYPQLKDQFKSMGESVFNNCWSSVHDFDRGLDGTNWAILPGDTLPTISIPSEGEFSQVGLSLESATSVVPLTVGSAGRPDAEVCLVVFFEQDGFEDGALEFTHRLQDKAVIVFTKKFSLESHQVSKLFPEDEDLRLKSSQGSIIVLDVSGEKCVRLCHQLLMRRGGEEGEERTLEEGVYISPSPEQGKLDSQALNAVMEISLTMQ